MEFSLLPIPKELRCYRKIMLLPWKPCCYLANHAITIKQSCCHVNQAVTMKNMLLLRLYFLQRDKQAVDDLSDGGTRGDKGTEKATVR